MLMFVVSFFRKVVEKISYFCSLSISFLTLAYTSYKILRVQTAHAQIVADRTHEISVQYKHAFNIRRNTVSISKLIQIIGILFY